MSKEQKPDSDQQQFWQMVLETFKSSGLSVRQFCKQEGLPEPAFYTWRKKLTKVDDPEADKEEVCQSEPFIQVSMPTDKHGGFELILTSGNTLRISSDTDSKTLVNVLSALCEAGLC